MRGWGGWEAAWRRRERGGGGGCLQGARPQQQRLPAPRGHSSRAAMPACPAALRLATQPLAARRPAPAPALAGRVFQHLLECLPHRLFLVLNHPAHGRALRQQVATQGGGRQRCREVVAPLLTSCTARSAWQTQSRVSRARQPWASAAAPSQCSIHKPPTPTHPPTHHHHHPKKAAPCPWCP